MGANRREFLGLLAGGVAAAALPVGAAASAARYTGSVYVKRPGGEWHRLVVDGYRTPADACAALNRAIARFQAAGAPKVEVTHGPVGRRLGGSNVAPVPYIFAPQVESA